MKTKLTSLITLFVFFFCLGCNKNLDELQPQKENLVSSSQLLKDRSFILLIQEQEKVSNVLYSRLRYLGSNRKRDENFKKIRIILNKGVNKSNIDSLSIYLGFRDSKEFITSISNIFKMKNNLNANYHEINIKHIQEASILYTKKNPNVSQNRGNGVCVEYFLNNCEECFGGTPPCFTCLENPNDEEPAGGDSGVKCRQACLNKKTAETNTAKAVFLAAAAVACPQTALECAGVGSAGGPIGTAAGGVLCLAACAAFDYYIYMQTITIIENDYVICVSGCN